MRGSNRWLKAVIDGNRWQSVARGGRAFAHALLLLAVAKADLDAQRHLEQMQHEDEAISGNQWQSVAISGNQWQSVAISGSQWQSVAITWSRCVTKRSAVR